MYFTDFSSDKTHFYYNNNVWSLYAMEEFGKFLTSTTGPAVGKNVTLGKALVADAARYRVDLARSIKTCTGKPSPDLSIAGMFYRSAHNH